MSGRIPLIVAHRGASGEAPENTLAAFRRALEIGVDGVELDVHLTSDGEPVVIHDPMLDRTTDGLGLVRDQTLAAVRRLDAGRWFGERFAGERVPTLAEALDLLRPVRVIVEVKNGPIYYPGIAARVAAEVRAAGHPSVTASSFDHPVLVELKAEATRLGTTLDTAVLYVGRPVNPVGLARDAGADALHPHWAYLTPELVGAAHAAGLRVETWTVDDPLYLAHVMGMAPDGVMSNHPGRLREFLAAHGHPLPPAAAS
ncbi:MAG: glycerophosphodiester phosphodiesterase family protein [bacterium]|nr:glycerophosphodiester phosphodiesterase family protein [bacterium]